MRQKKQEVSFSDRIICIFKIIFVFLQQNIFDIYERKTGKKQDIAIMVCIDTFSASNVNFVV